MIIFQNLKEYLQPFLKSITVKWSQLSESNRRPTDYKSVALPTELSWLRKLFLVPDQGLEP